MENSIHVAENWLVQGFAWYKIVEIIIASEKFIVFKNVLRDTYGPRVSPHFRHATHTDSHWKRRKKHYFAKRVCFMCHNLTFSHCILSSADVIIVIAATVSVVIATERYVPYIHESCFRWNCLFAAFWTTLRRFVLFRFVCWFAL